METEHCRELRIYRRTLIEEYKESYEAQETLAYATVGLDKQSQQEIEERIEETKQYIDERGDSNGLLGRESVSEYLLKDIAIESLVLRAMRDALQIRLKENRALKFVKR